MDVVDGKERMDGRRGGGERRRRRRRRRTWMSKATRNTFPQRSLVHQEKRHVSQCTHLVSSGPSIRRRGSLPFVLISLSFPFILRVTLPYYSFAADGYRRLPSIKQLSTPSTRCQAKIQDHRVRWLEYRSSIDRSWNVATRILASGCNNSTMYTIPWTMYRAS